MHLENGTYEPILSHLEKELELNGLEAPDEMQKDTVTQQASQQNSGKSKPTCHHCKKLGHYRNQCPQLKPEKDPARKNKNSADSNDNKVAVSQTPTPTIKILTIPMQTIQIIKKTEDLDLSTHPVTSAVKPTIPQRNVTLQQTQRTDQLPGTDDDWKDKTKSNREMPKATQMGMFKLQPKL